MFGQRQFSKVTNDLGPAPTPDRETADVNRNALYLIVGALVVVVAFLGYQNYQDRKQPDGLQINVGKKGLEIKGK